MEEGTGHGDIGESYILCDHNMMAPAPGGEHGGTSRIRNDQPS